MTSITNLINFEIEMNKNKLTHLPYFTIEKNNNNMIDHSNDKNNNDSNRFIKIRSMKFLIQENQIEKI